MIKNVKVCGSKYDIEYVEDLKDGNDILYGHIDYAKLLITINNQHRKEQQLKTILHEIIHAMAEENLFGWKEKTVTIVTNNILTLLIDNKNFFKEILNVN